MQTTPYRRFKNYCQGFYDKPEQKITKRLTKDCSQGSVYEPIFWDITIEEISEGVDNNNNISLLLIERNFRLVLRLAIETNIRKIMQ